MWRKWFASFEVYYNLHVEVLFLDNFYSWTNILLFLGNLLAFPIEILWAD